jgi:asparagine synthase (glutamine-hydrolysing)
MCGLVGALAYADAAPGELEAPIRALTQLMARRGPDDDGAWSDRRCALGFRRLAILDLSPAGHQPMATADGRYVLVFNGEIYNYRELRAALEARDEARTDSPRSTGDAEVLLLALRAWGIGALDRLRGMFALACYDTAERTLLLARDHAGIKPLFVARTRSGVVFGSQYDQLLAHPWCRGAAVDPGGLGLYLRFGFLPAGFGLHAGLGQVEAGQWQKFDARGHVTTGRFFALPRWREPALRGPAAIEALDEALGRAVDRHLASDVPVGVLLSGGIDSPLVAAEAVRRAGRLKAFTIGVDDPALDETAAARRYAEQIGLEPGVDHVVETIAAGDVAGLVDDVVAACTEPTADYSIFPTLLVSRLARRHVKVVLSGDGGDELYWGYPSRFASAIAQARYFRWPRAARFAAVAARRLRGGRVPTRDVLEFRSLGRLYQRKHTLMAEADLAAVFPALPALPEAFDAFELGAAASDDEAAQWVRWNEFQIHLARVLAKVDRASMFHSLEVRVPLLDRDVIDVAWQTDWRSCLDLDTRIGKRPLRAALRRRLGWQTTAKRGFTVPMHDWLRGPLRPLVQDLLLDRRELLGLPVAPGAIRTLDDRLVAGDRSVAWGLWLVLSLALWQRAHAGPA